MVSQPISVEIEDAALRAALMRIAAVLASPSAVMDQIGRYLVASTLRRFERERAPDGSPWLKSARALAEGGRTLTDTGRLRGSIAHTVTEGGRAVEVGSDVLYAAIHQLGGRAGRGRRVTLPARPYLGIDEDDRANILRIVARALERTGT
ncbi:MAG: phage virion morphogenesis protein [Rhodospirillaceae bacterium]|nr:phage virion morphogenesis protein [Rhodospirillaceae bacterium]